MAHWHVTDFDKPDRFGPEVRAEVLAEARQAVRRLADQDGTLHLSEVLEVLE